MIRRVFFWLRRVPSWIWGILALSAVLGIPNTVNTLLLPDDPVFARVQVRALRQVILQCVGSSLLLTVFVGRACNEARGEQQMSDGSQHNMHRSCLWLGIADILGGIVIVVLCLSLWTLSGMWLLSLLLGTCLFQAHVLYRHPSRIKMGAAWVAVWVIVALMVLIGVG